MFIRFAIGSEDQNPRDMHGPFTEVAYLRKQNILERYEEAHIADIFNNFNENLPCPPWHSNSWPNDAVSWFKVSAQDFISQMYELVVILNQYDIHTRILKCDKFFKIFYEDEFQVVAFDKRF